MSDDLELFHFPRSHYNEKVRWALDYKGLPHRRRALLPGPHRPRMQRLSGQSQVPVLRHGSEVVAGSARIIDHLERRFPEPRLVPADPSERARALEIQAWFDEELGPAIRRAGFAALMRDPAYFARIFTDDRGALVRAGYRAILPAIRRLMKRDLDITPDAVGRALETTRQAFDLVAKEAGPEGHLVAGRFSVADLAAASLLAPAVHPEGFPRFPEPHPPVLREWLARWSDHPGAAWVREVYRRHRGASHAIQRRGPP